MTLTPFTPYALRAAVARAAAQPGDSRSSYMLVDFFLKLLEILIAGVMCHQISINISNNLKKEIYLPLRNLVISRGERTALATVGDYYTG